jgi:hypothetical protein
MNPPSVGRAIEPFQKHSSVEIPGALGNAPRD